jgi:hypothetical protein
MVTDRSEHDLIARSTLEKRMVRRWSLGLAISVALHAAAVGGVVGWVLLRDAAPRRVDVEIAGMRMEELEELPLGPPPGGDEGARPRRAHARAPDVEASSGTLASKNEKEPPRAGSDEETVDEGPPPHISDLRQLGPEGSRLTILLRVDRLKATPFAGPVDALLLRLPDRRDLLQGTDLDLYDDFDALLISTPNPLDPAVTFLAARHHLSDASMRAAVDRGARATGRVVTWHEEDGRPYGERKAGKLAAASASVHDLPATRASRIIVLPAPGLVVVTPPTYRALLLARPSPPPAADAGAGAATTPTWTSLLRRIDAEDTLMPPNGIAMVSAVDILKSKRGRGSQGNDVGQVLFLGVEIEIPRVITAVLGSDPEPFVDVTAEYATDEEAQRTEAAWPELQRKLRTNPYVVLGGFSAVIGRVTLQREGNSIHLKETATSTEALRIFQMIAQAFGGEPTR